MNLYEALKISGCIIPTLCRLGYKHGDYKHINLFEDYISMKCGGAKITYIVAILADKYCVSERTVYNVIKRFSKNCNSDALG